MGIAQSALVAVANLNVQFTAFVMVSTMILCSPRRNDRKDWKGWSFFVLAIYFYHMVVRFGANVQDPLDLYTTQNYIDARTILFIIDPILAFFYGLLGWAFARVLDIVDLVPMRKRVHFPLRSQPKVKFVIDSGGQYTIQNMSEDPDKPGKKWGVVGLVPSWFQILISLVWYLGGFATPQILYDWFIQQAGSEWWSYIILCLVPIGATAVFLIICLVWTDPGTFGLTERYMKNNRDQFNFDDKQMKKIAGETRMRVVRSIVTPGALGIISNIILGGVRLGWYDADPQWIASVALWGAYFLILLLVVAITRFSANPFRKGGKNRPVKDGGNFVTEIAGLFL